MSDQQRFRFARPVKDDEEIDLQKDEDILLEQEIGTEESPELVKRVVLLRTELSGGHLNGKPGDVLRLIRVPDNPNDRWTIRVESQQGVLLGYIPYGAGQSTARLMDAGKKITADISAEGYVTVYMEIPVKETEKA